MDHTVPENQWLDRAFKLACFIHRDRTTAIRVATEAMSKLEVASAAQDKRLYYTLTGRSSARKSRNKVLLGEAHLLQRLVYVESEIYERQKEERGLSNEEDMIIHFIKHLVRITIKRNSFYVTLGLSRLLHNYTTSETQDIYNVVVQDPDRFRDDYYYRSRKAQLMRELKERFGDLLKAWRGQRGEERFHSIERLDEHVSLVEKCLRFFTPWNTPCLMSAGFDPFNDLVPQFSFKGDEPDMEHVVEINRMHAVLDPECYGRLVGALSFDQPERRLDVPHFFLSGYGGNGDGPRAGRDHLAELSKEDVLAVSGALAERAARRRTAGSGLLRLLVDGNEHAQLDVRRDGNVRFPIEEGAEMVEVRTDDGSADLLLAVHLLEIDDEASNGHRPLKRSIVLEGGQELSFSVTRSNDSVGEAVVDVAYRETSPVRAASLWLRRLGYRVSETFSVESGSSILKPALALAFTILCAAMVVFYFQSRKSAPALEEAATQPKPFLPAENSPPVPSVNPPSGVANQKAPIPSREQNRRSPGRVPIAAAAPQVAKLVEAPPSENTLSEDEATRALRVERIAASLSAVKRIYVESTGEEALRREVQSAFISALQPGARFAIATSLDDADAVLKTSVRRAQSKGKVLVIARLVNANGEVIWPVIPRGSGEKYLGSPGAAAARIVEDLLNTVRELESKRK